MAWTTKNLEQWAALGGRTFARETRIRDESKKGVVLTFPAMLNKDTTGPLREADLRFNKVCLPSGSLFVNQNRADLNAYCRSEAT